MQLELKIAVNFQNLTRTAYGKRPQGKYRRKWEDNNRINFKEIGVNMRKWIGSSQGGELLESPCEYHTETAGLRKL